MSQRSEETTWIVTFLGAIGLFLLLYLFTLWFGNSLGQPHH